MKARNLPYLILTILSLVTLQAGTASAAEKTGEDLINELQLLYVQSADAGSFDGKRLTLEGVGTTLFFSDRPARVRGHIDTDKFVGMYVNHWTLDYGDKGRAAIRELLDRAHVAGLIPQVQGLEFVTT